MVRSQPSENVPQLPQPLSKTNQNEERRRKVTKHHQPLLDKPANRNVASCGRESDKENESISSSPHYSSIDEDSNQSEVIREAEMLGMWSCARIYGPIVLYNLYFDGIFFFGCVSVVHSTFDVLSISQFRIFLNSVLINFLDYYII